MLQLSLFSAPPPVHGGELAIGKRKVTRPLASKPILFFNRSLIKGEIRRKAERFGLKVYSVAIPANHIHLILKIPSREAYAAFVRTLTAALARRWGKGLWKWLPFTRVMAWGKDFRQMLAYLQKNRDEAEGGRAYEPRKDWYRKWKIRNPDCP